MERKIHMGIYASFSLGCHRSESAGVDASAVPQWLRQSKVYDTVLRIKALVC